MRSLLLPKHSENYYFLWSFLHESFLHETMALYRVRYTKTFKFIFPWVLSLRGLTLFYPNFLQVMSCLKRQEHVMNCKNFRTKAVNKVKNN